MLCVSRENSLKYPTYFFLEEWEEKKGKKNGEKRHGAIDWVKEQEGGIGLLGKVINAVWRSSVWDAGGKFKKGCF